MAWRGRSRRRPQFLTIESCAIPLFYEYRIAQVSRGRSCSGREQQGAIRFWAAKTMNRAAQAASGRPSGIGACELAGFSCKRSYLVLRFYAMVARGP